MKKYLYALLLVFTAVTGFYFFYSWSLLPPGERFIYQIDDPYIHMAIAKNFALNGVWSINSGGFDSASSSILYTLLLTSLIKLFGIWEFYPLVINVICGYLAIYTVYRYFKDFYGAAELKWAIALLLPFSLLYAMVLISMEHTVHMFLMVLAIYFIHKNVESNFQTKDFIKLLTVVFFVSIVRFESMFFTASLAFAMFLRKEFAKGILVMVAGFSAIVIFGIISEIHGGYFFPNSVMIKGSLPSGNNIVENVVTLVKKGIFLNTSFYKCLFFPFVILIVYLTGKYRSKKINLFFKNETLMITIFSMSIIHSLFAFLKYRYENYVMISVLMVVIPVISAFFKRFNEEKRKLNIANVVMLFSLVMMTVFSLYRFQFMHKPSMVSSKNIYEQQVEMSRFLGKYYRGQKVAANDIGAISYYSGVQLFDIVGLGSTQVAKFKMENKKLPRKVFDEKYRNFLINYTAKNNFVIAVIYPEWFPGTTPASWIPVASWKIQHNKAAAIDRVVFYALEPEQVKSLQQNLMKFDLNKNVEQWFYVLK